MEILVTQDETIAALRRVCDRHFDKIVAWHAFQRTEHLPREFVRDVVACLGDGIIERVRQPASGANCHFLTVRISSLLNAYVALAAQYLLGRFCHLAAVPV